MTGEPTLGMTTRHAVEAAVRAAVSEASGRAALDDKADFFAVGLDSMGVAAIIAGLQRRLGVDVPLAAAFEHPSVAGLAAYLTESTRPALMRHPPAAVPGDYFPAPAMTTHLARRMGPAWELTPAPVWAAVELPAGELDVPTLTSALDVLVERHEALRVSLHRRGDEVLARLDPASPIPLEVVDARDAAIDQVVVERRRRLFDLGRAPLAVFTLIRATGRDVLCAVFDHDICDVWALRMVLQEIGQLCAGEPSTRAGAPELTFSQWCAIERGLRAGTSEDTADFWSALIEPVARTAPGLAQPPGAASGRMVARWFTVGAKPRRRLVEQAAAAGLSLFTLLAGHLLNAVRVVLEVDRVPVSLFSLNRDLLGTPSLLACTARQLWTSVDLTGRTTSEQAAAVFQRRLVKAVSRQMTPPFMVLDELSARFGGEWEPWLSVAMRIAQPVPGFPSGPARLRPVPAPKEISAPLDLHIVDHGTHLAFDLTGWPDFVTPRMADRLVRVLAAAGTVPEPVAASA